MFKRLRWMGMGSGAGVGATVSMWPHRKVTAAIGRGYRPVRRRRGTGRRRARPWSPGRTAVGASRAGLVPPCGPAKAELRQARPGRSEPELVQARNLWRTWTPTPFAAPSPSFSSSGANRRCPPRADPAPPAGPAVHQRRDEPVHPLLPRRGVAALPRATTRPEVCPHPGQARRHRPDRSHDPASHLLRDARQLQLRRLLQGPRPSRWPGSC